MPLVSGTPLAGGRLLQVRPLVTHSQPLASRHRTVRQHLLIADVRGTPRRSMPHINWTRQGGFADAGVSSAESVNRYEWLIASRCPIGCCTAFAEPPNTQH